MRHTSPGQTHRARWSRSAVVGGVLLLAAVLGGCGEDDGYIRVYGDDYPHRGYTTGTTVYYDNSAGGYYYAGDGVVYDGSIYRGTSYGTRGYHSPKVVVVDPPRRSRISKKYRHRYDRRDRRRLSDRKRHDRNPHFDKRRAGGIEYGLRRPSKHHPPLLPPSGESFRDGEWEWDDGRWEWDD